ncbi:MAG: AMP-binding protein [Minwuiales bacterium]|nr:AMP-binding protein [Minwuiales bacterium]
MSDVETSLKQHDTLPKLLLRNARERGNRTAFREKDFGIWQSWTWAEVADEIRAFACGLADLGVRRGDKVAIIGANRPQLYWSFDAIESIGAIAVPLYADSVAEEMQYVLDHAEVKFAICEDQEQVDKVASVKDRVTALEAIVYKDTRGMRHYTDPYLHALEDIQKRGRAYDKENPAFFEAEVAQAKGSDIALIAYTSGTTGNPKGVMLTANNLIESASLAVEMERLTDKEETLAYLPLAWVGDHFFSVAQQHVTGYAVNCPESSDTVMTDLRDIGPTSFIAPPAIFESFLTQIQIRMADASWLKRKLFDYFIGVADRCGIDVLEGRPVPFVDRLFYALGNFVVYGPLKNNLGLSRMRLAYTGGAPLGDEVFKFYRSIGVNLKQLYGQTESSAYVCMQRDGDVKVDTVGPPCPGVEVRITEDGEVLYKSPGTFVGYYKNAEATEETLDSEGWVHTGDAGFFDDGGHLKIIDRAKDVGQLKDGTLFAPQYIENKLKFFSYVKEAVAHGAGRDEVACFITIDLEAVGNWAERNGISYTNYADISSRDEVYDLVRDCIEEVNRSLAKDSALSGSQIRRFLLLHKELDADDGELTRTRKVRRRIIADRYKPLIDALYSEADRAAIETQVTFEDGRTGLMKADLAIRSAKTFAPAAGAAAPVSEAA